jgi:intein/homing endonuclease
MERRIVFDSAEIRKLFFKEILKFFKFETWKQLQICFGIPKSMLEFYRNGKLTLPEDLYKKLSNKISDEDKILFNNKIKFLDSNWGNIKGGKATYSKHKEIFEEGRKKAIFVARKKAADKFDIYMSLNEDLAYFLGLFVGDGFTNKYSGYYMIEITGDKRTEKEFYINYLGPLIKNFFNLNFRITEPKESNGFRFIFYSKTLFKMITERFNIPAGRKSHSVLIPKEILDAKPEIIARFLRGLYDAEGCVFFDKRKQYKKPYPRIELHMCNLALLKQVSESLTKMGIKNVLGTSEKNLRVTIWGFDEVKNFINKIGFSNPKQLKKLGGLKD